MAIKRICDICKDTLSIMDESDHKTVNYRLFKYKGEVNEVEMDLCKECLNSLIKEASRHMPNLPYC